MTTEDAASGDNGRVTIRDLYALQGKTMEELGKLRADFNALIAPVMAQADQLARESIRHEEQMKAHVAMHAMPHDHPTITKQVEDLRVWSIKTQAIWAVVVWALAIAMSAGLWKLAFQ